MSLIALQPSDRFVWVEQDFGHLLPTGWANDIIAFAKSHETTRTLTASSVTSRETAQDTKIPVLTVGGNTIRTELPWLFDLYRGTFQELGQSLVAEALSVANDTRYAINLNVQRAGMRYECHVDSNPLEGLLYVTTHAPGEGGELVVSNDPDALGPDEIERDCVRIHPASGKLVFFDARRFPHYVAPLSDPSAVRIAVAMNYYTPSCPESARPADLNHHLFGKD